jgi:segregation and condensation protein B
MSTPESNTPAAVVNDNDEIDVEEDIALDGDLEGTEDNDNSSPSEDDIQAAKRLVEALLFASASPMTERVLANRVQEGINIKSVLKDLQEDYAERGVHLNRAGTSWAFRTADDLSAVLNVETEVTRKMNRAGIETMSVIAYHQPVTRAEIEEIRGVSLSKGTLDLLFDKGWIKPRGRRETPGRPMTWGTTDDFLDHFGLTRISDLPGLDELKAAGLLESGPALNVYRSHIGGGQEEEGENGEEGENPASLAPFSSQGEEDALPEVDDAPEEDEPLDPDSL